nr:hypothetical protein [Marinicella sp. W31]MDC2879993.1 hypothetical protein [Marinicella sp. W31]
MLRAGYTTTKYDRQTIEIHDYVAEEMFEILAGEAVPIYLDRQAAALLSEAR